MSDKERHEDQLGRIGTEIGKLRASLDELSNSPATTLKTADRGKLVSEAGTLIARLREFREKISPVRFGSIGISLGKSDGIAKFFAFCFLNQDLEPLDQIVDSPFFGSGVYAIYYRGKSTTAYLPLSVTETPIYVGKTDPKNPDAETVEEQGQTIYKRLKEHSKNIDQTDLLLEDFVYRAAPIQSGMQAAVEEFMIRLFRPIWNKQTKICFGIGKHGDSASTRKNKRSPWDTMHPGRPWANRTAEDQKSKREIEKEIERHFTEHPVIATRQELFRLLAL